MTPVNQVHDALRQTVVETLQDRVHLGARIEDDAGRPILVLLRVRQGLFEQVGERAVSDVVQQRCRERVARALRGQSLPKRQLFVQTTQPSDQTSHHAGSADSMGEARVIGSRIRERGEAGLADPAQPLDFSALEQRRDDGLLGRLERDEAVDWVSQNHGRRTLRHSIRCAGHSAHGGRGPLAAAPRAHERHEPRKDTPESEGIFPKWAKATARVQRSEVPREPGRKPETRAPKQQTEPKPPSKSKRRSKILRRRSK
jgi:hypothetical protein